MSHADDGTLHAYLDGELSPVERAQLEAHLASCPACRGRLDEERALVERADALLATAAPPETAPPPFQGLGRPRPARRFRLPLAWAATVLLALGAGWYAGSRFYRPGGSLPSAAPVAGAVTSDLDTTRPIEVAQRPSLPPVSRPAAREAVRAPRRDSAPPPVSPTLAPTVIATAPRAEMKASGAPAPAPAAANFSADRAVTQARPRWVPVVLTTSWQIIGLDAARPTLGTDPVTVPGLPVRDVRRSPLGDGVVVVEQAVDSTTVIQLFQRRADLVALDGQPQPGAAGVARQRSAEPAVAAAAPRPPERLARYVGTLRVEIAGPLSADSLSKLLELVK